MKWAIFLKRSTTEEISVFSPLVRRPVTKARETWKIDVGETVEMEGVLMGLDKLMLTDEVQVIILQPTKNIGEHPEFAGHLDGG